MRKIISLLQIIILATWSSLCVVFALLTCLILLSKRPAFFYSKYIWAPVALRIMGGRLVIKGVENIAPQRSYVVMANHCSYLDIAAMLIAFPIDLHFIAKKELKRMPFVGWFITLAGMIYIDRKNTNAAKASLAQAAELIHKGHHVAIYPEGTASKTGEIGTFKKGGFHLAQDASADIIPVHIKGTNEVWPSGNKLKVRSGKIEVIIGKPISPDEYMIYPMDNRIHFVKNQIINL